MFGLVQGIGQALAAMHPDWAWVNITLIGASAVGLVSVLIWWAWTVTYHSATVSIRAKQYAFSGVVGALSFALIALCTLLVNGSYFSGVIGGTQTDGLFRIKIPPSLYAPKAEWRAHQAANGNWTPTYAENIFRGFATSTSMDLVLGAQATPLDTNAVLRETHVFVIFSRPVRVKDKSQFQVTFSSPNAPEFHFSDGGPYWAYFVATGPLPEGDLDVFVRGATD